MTDKFNRSVVIISLIVAACTLALCGLADATIVAVVGVLAGPVSTYITIKGKGAKPE